MPKKYRLKSAMGTQREDEGPVRAVHVPLDLEERDTLRKIYADSAFKKAFTNAKLMKPSAFAGSEPLNGVLGGQIANNRLHQIQGWEMFEAALILQVQDPKPVKSKIQETFPDDPFFASSIQDNKKP